MDLGNLAILVVGLVLYLPLLTYLMFKAARLGYLHAEKTFVRSYTNQEMSNGDGEEEA